MDFILRLFRELLAVFERLADERGQGGRSFGYTTEFDLALREMAAQEGISEDEAYFRLAEDGLKQRQMMETLSARWERLTDREKEVAALAILGRRNYEIAELLVISVPTVKTHLQNVFVKMRINSRKELRYLFQDFDFSDWDVAPQN